MKAEGQGFHQMSILISANGKVSFLEKKQHHLQFITVPFLT